MGANLTAANLLGVTREGLIQQLMSRFILKEDQDIYYLFRKQLFYRGKPQACELRFVRQNGTSFWAHLESTLTQDENGISVSRLVLSDISDRKHIENALKEVHRQNVEILESSADAFLALTDDMIVSYVNLAAEQTFNQKRIDMIGRSICNVFPEWKGTIFEKNFAQAIRKKSGMSFQVDFTVASYQDWYDVRVYPKSDGITICIRVITERKQANEEKAKLESFNRQVQKAKSLRRMAGAIAHHFNNKLFSVISYLDLTIDDLPHGDIAKKNLIIARKEAVKAAEVSKLILSYLGQVSGKLQLLDLSDISQKMLPLLEITLPENIVIKTDLQVPGPIIKANADQVRQVLTNLVTNAWEATGNVSDSIHLSVKKVLPAVIPTSYRFPIDWQPQNTAYACLEVRDNGCGIAAKDIEEIFSPFFSTKFTGRGLGLSVTLGLIKIRDAVITVESVTSKGSVFRVFFPVFKEDHVQQAKDEKPTQEYKETGKVLLVDDDLVVLEITSLMLSTIGFTVLRAIDGIEAVHVFRKHKNEIRLVLSDVSMPRMGGWETLGALREIMPDIPMILASGYGEEQVMDGPHTERPQAFLGKPYNLDALREAIRRTLLETKK